MTELYLALFVFNTSKKILLYKIVHSWLYKINMIFFRNIQHKSKEKYSTVIKSIRFFKMTLIRRANENYVYDIRKLINYLKI